MCHGIPPRSGGGPGHMSDSKDLDKRWTDCVDAILPCTYNLIAPKPAPVPMDPME